MGNRLYILLFSLLILLCAGFYLQQKTSNAQGTANTLILQVVADTFISRKSPTQNFGAAELLEIDRFDADTSLDHKVPLLRFNLNDSRLQNMQIVSAKLTFFTNKTDTLHKTIRLVKDTGWKEDQLTYKEYVVPEAPLMLQSLKYSVVAAFVPSTKENSVDVTEGVKDLVGNSIVFAFENDRGGAPAIYSKENKSGIAPATLVLQIEPKPVESVAIKSYSCPLVPIDKQSSSPDQNPMSGLYRWSNLFYNPNGSDIYDAYARYTWDQIEKSDGVYDFSAIENDITKFFGTEKNAGKKYAFRVRAMRTSGNDLPVFMKTSPYIKKCTVNGVDEDVPNWDDPAYIVKTQKLITAIANKYDGDQRIAWMDMGAYGRWGEWHMSGYTGCKATVETEQSFINMYLNAFKKTQLQISGTEQEMAAYALAQTRDNPARLNIRKDCVGFDDLYCSYSLFNSLDLLNELKDRWKYAPFTSEFGNPASADNPQSFWYGQAEASALHIALLGNGNTFKWADISPAGQEAFTKIDQLLGYSYVLNDVSVTGPIVPGATVTVQTSWSNYGSTPTYEPWTVTLLLVDSSGKAVLQQPLKADLRTVLPTYNRIIEKNIPVIKNDSVVIPSNVSAGEYTPYITVTDARMLSSTDPNVNDLTKNNPRKPMQLAGNTKKDSGYELCKMIVQSAGQPTVVQTQAPVPSSTPIASTVTTMVSSSPTTIPCPLKSKGDADCDGKVSLTDLEIWTREFLGERKTSQANFDGSKQLPPVTLQDLQIWQDTYLK